MRVSSSEIIEDTAKYLDLFLNGLSECGVIGNYTIQFLELAQFSVKDNLVIRNQVLQLYINLQVLLKKLQTSLDSESQIGEAESNSSSYLVLKHSCSNQPTLIDCEEKEKKILIFKSHSNKQINNEEGNCLSVSEVNDKVEISKCLQRFPALNRDDPVDVLARVTLKEEENETTFRDDTELNIPEIMSPMSSEDSVSDHVRRICTIHLREPNGTAHLLKGLFTKNNRFKVDKKYIELEEEVRTDKQEVSHANLAKRNERRENIEPSSIVSSAQEHFPQDSVEGSFDEIFETKRVAHFANKSVLTDTSQAIFADIIKLGPNDLNGHPWCQFCQKEFPSAGSLKRHLTNSHTKVLWCHSCLKAVSSKAQMKRHIAQYHLDVPNICIICGKTFKSQHSLQRHLEVHNGSRGTACEICGQTFARSEYHKEHMRVHTGEKPFKCDVCKKCFGKSSNLKTHMLVHKPPNEGHVCTLCLKVFRRQDKLKDHTMRHLKIKRFACKLCSKAYSEKRDLTKHIMKIHNLDQSVIES